MVYLKISKSFFRSYRASDFDRTVGAGLYEVDEDHGEPVPAILMHMDVVTRSEVTSMNKEMREVLARAAALRKEASDLECSTIRSALEKSHWLPAYAADLLGINRLVLRDWLRRRYVELGKEAREMRVREGYRGGNPKLYDL